MERGLHYSPKLAMWLHQALVTNPERAKLISTLHIGPQDVLPADWWPLRNRSGPQIGRGSSRYSQLWYERLPGEESYLSESESGRLWLLNGEPSGCKQVAVRDALYVAQRSLGVDLVREDFGVTLTRQMEALFEVQAALDLYIGEITRIDEADKMQGLQKHRHCLASKCRHYPPLFVRDTPTRPQSFAVPDGAFLLHDTQLIRHLARRGACTDRFDHPLLLSRSGFDCDVRFPTERRTESQVRYRLRRQDFPIMALRERLRWSKTTLLQEEDERVASSTGSSKPLNSAVINTANLGSVLPLARAVLNLCTSVETVSLTGFLPHLLRGGLRVPNLRRVSLGPSLPNWNDQLTLNTLSHIEELRVSGWPLREDPIEMITRHMSRLKRLEWGRESKMSDRSQDGIKDLIDRLAQAGGSGSSARMSSQDTHQGSSRGTDAVTRPQILVRLHPADVSHLHDLASPETSLAWSEGTPATIDLCPLRLVMHPHAASGSSRPYEDHTNPVWLPLFEEGMVWRQKWSRQ